MQKCNENKVYAYTIVIPARNEAAGLVVLLPQIVALVPEYGNPRG
jgi:hypothetical protein